ncbi:MAG: phosphatidylserine decarboxylase, partial [Methylomicrobium sp.]
ITLSPSLNSISSPAWSHRVKPIGDGLSSPLFTTLFIQWVSCFCRVQSNSAINRISDLFAKNERVVNIFNTEAGPMALILIGSIFSSSIETVWDGVITPSPKSEIRQWNYPFNPPFAKKGEEMGRLNLGSTVIVLFSKDKVKWETNLVPGSRVQMGELIGKTSL